MEHLFAPSCYPRWIQPGLPPHLDRTDNNRGKHLYRKSGASVCGQCQCVLLGTCASSGLSHCLADKMPGEHTAMNSGSWHCMHCGCSKVLGFFPQETISNYKCQNCCPFWICPWLERDTPSSLHVISGPTSKIKVKPFHCHIKEILSSA